METGSRYSPIILGSVNRNDSVKRIRNESDFERELKTAMVERNLAHSVYRRDRT